MNSVNLKSLSIFFLFFQFSHTLNARVVTHTYGGLGATDCSSSSSTVLLKGRMICEHSVGKNEHLEDISIIQNTDKYFSHGWIKKCMFTAKIKCIIGSSSPTSNIDVGQDGLIGSWKINIGQYNYLCIERHFIQSYSKKWSERGDYFCRDVDARPNDLMEAKIVLTETYIFSFTKLENDSSSNDGLYNRKDFGFIGIRNCRPNDSKFSDVLVKNTSDKNKKAILITPVCSK